MYGIKDLIALAKVKRGKINGWKKSGLLPEPTLVKSKRGKPTEMYPQETLGIVLALSRWYSSVKNPDKAKIFLWLEGFVMWVLIPNRLLETGVLINGASCGGSSHVYPH